MAKSFLTQNKQTQQLYLHKIVLSGVKKSTLYMFWQIAYNRFIKEKRGIYLSPNVEKLFACSMLKNWQSGILILGQTDNVYKKLFCYFI
jgi:hypothetical protein